MPLNDRPALENCEIEVTPEKVEAVGVRIASGVEDEGDPLIAALALACPGLFGVVLSAVQINQAWSSAKKLRASEMIRWSDKG